MIARSACAQWCELAINQPETLTASSTPMSVTQALNGTFLTVKHTLWNAIKALRP